MQKGLTRRPDFLGGMLMVLIGGAAALDAQTYPVGTLAEMGPGYFPMVVGILLAVVGLIIALSAAVSGEASGEIFRPDWRGWAGIISGTVAFIVLGSYGGLVPATFAIVFLSALGDRQNNLIQAALLSLAMVVVAAVVFRWGLQIQLPLFTWS